MRLARLFTAALGAAALGALATGCGESTAATPGTGGSPTPTDATSSASSGTPASDCPNVSPLDAGLPDGFALDVTPGADDDALCTALATQSMQCSPGCPIQDHTTCALEWACTKRLLRPDMISDLYACMPTLSCAASGDPIGACAAKLRDKYPPTAAQQAYEAAVEACSTGTSPCADGSCGGLSDAEYDALTSCFQESSDCSLGTAFCLAITADLDELSACYGVEPSDGGAGDGGELDGGGASDGG